MSLLSRLLHKRPSIDTRRRQASDYLPWAAFVAPGVVLCKDGALLRFAEFAGPDVDSQTPEALDAHVGRVNDLYKRIGTGYAVWTELQKRSAEPYPQSIWTCRAAELMDDELRAAYGAREVRFNSHYYMAIQYLPPPSLESKVRALYVVNSEQDEADYRAILNRFIQTTDDWFSLARKTFPFFRPLSDTACMSYLYSIVNAEHVALAEQAVPIGVDYICAASPITPGFEPRIGETHVRAISIKGFPKESFAAILKDVDRLAIPFRFSHRWIGLDRADGDAFYLKARTKWHSKRQSAKNMMAQPDGRGDPRLENPEAGVRLTEANDALRDQAEAKISSGICTPTIIVYGRSKAEVDENARLAKEAINNCGFVAFVETLNAFDAWLGTLPGLADANVRQPILSSLNLSHIGPFNALWPGEAVNRHLKGPALLYTKTAGNSTFRLNLHVADIGHTLIIGPTGAGKSYLLNAITLAFQKYPGARILGIDKDSSTRATTLAAGGHFFDVSSRRFAGFQPLRNIDKPEVHDWAVGWVRMIAEQGHNKPLDTRQVSHITDALALLERRPLGQRTLGAFKALVQDQEIKQALVPFTGTGPYGYLFDRGAEELQDHFWQVFELGHFHERKDIAKIITSYLYHRFDQMFDGTRPTILFLEEAWVHLDSAEESERLRERLKTVRKKNVSILFNTQDLVDIQRSPIASTVFQNVSSKILLPNSKAADLEIKPIYKAIGLNDQQVAIIAAAAPKAQYYYLSELGARLFEVPSGPITRVLCGTTDKADHLLIDEILERHGADRFLDHLLSAKGIAA